MFHFGHSNTDTLRKCHFCNRVLTESILPCPNLTRPVMIIRIRARTLATVEMTCRIAPHFTFIQFTYVSRPAKEKAQFFKK